MKSDCDNATVYYEQWTKSRRLPLTKRPVNMKIKFILEIQNVNRLHEIVHKFSMLPYNNRNPLYPPYVDVPFAFSKTTMVQVLMNVPFQR